MNNLMDYYSINNQKKLILNEMISTTGCTDEQAKQFLILTEWRLEPARNLFFAQRTIPIPSCKYSQSIVPSNSPSTPPNFRETLLAFGKLSTSNK